jgi:hypothetical protein
MLLAAAAVLQTWMHGCERWAFAVVLLCTDLLGGTLGITTGVFCTLARFCMLGRWVGGWTR